MKAQIMVQQAWRMEVGQCLNFSRCEFDEAFPTNPFPFGDQRPPDLIIEPENPYMLRWHLIPRNRFFNIYLHKFLRSDDDRALHDHPWSWNLSLILKGEYIEHMPENPKTYGKIVDNFFAPEFKDWDFDTIKKVRRAWRPIFRKGVTPHRVELFGDALHPDFTSENYHNGTLPPDKPVWTIFITGSNVREWGFYCPKGWRSHKEFLKKSDGVSEVGRGCN